MDEEVVYGDMWGFTNRGKIRRRADLEKNSKENLDKDSPYNLLMFTWDQGLHCIGSQIIVELVDM